MTDLDALPLSRKQLASVARADARVCLWEGAVRSGKTVASLLAFLIAAAQAPHGGALVVIGRTRESIARNVFGPLSDPALFGPVAQLVHYTAGAPSARVLGRLVWVMGASDARAEGTLRGLTVALAYVDELTLVAEPFWTQLLARCSLPRSQILATTNPDGPAHWAKRQVVDRAAELGYKVWQFRLDDNPHLPAEYVAQLHREYTGLWRRRMILGEWTIAEGAVYDMWDPTRHVMPTDLADALPLRMILGTGVDHGTTNPTRGYLAGVTTETPARLVVLDEWAPPTGLPDARQAESYRAWLAAQPTPERRAPRWHAIDPAAASFRVQLRADGMRGVINADNPVVDGIRTVASVLSADRLVVADRCRHLVTQLPGYSWDPKKTEKGEDAPLKVNDHEPDALRYLVHTLRREWARWVELTDTRPPPAITEEAA